MARPNYLECSKLWLWPCSNGEAGKATDQKMLGGSRSQCRSGADDSAGRLDWCVQNLVNIRRPIELLLDLRNDVP